MKMLPKLTIPWWTLLIFVRLTVATAQQPSTELKPALFREDHGTQTALAIDRASKEGRRDLLVIGLENPDLWHRQQAAEMLCLLSKSDEFDGLVTVLRRDSLWIKQVNGGRNLGLQDQFVEAVQTSVANLLHTDISALDLFEKKTRETLVQRIQLLQKR